MAKRPEPQMTPGDQTPAPRGKGKFRETVEALAIALVLALIIRTFVVQAFKIPSGSMEDTLLIGDHLLVNKFLYGVQNPLTGERYLPIRQPQRGDIIVFEYPEDSQNSELYFWQRRDYIKRIIGLPGDTVELRNKQVFVNGELFRIDQEVHKEPFMTTNPDCTLPFGNSMGCRDSMLPVTVPANHYFVMGDNRDRSADSRFWGFVPEENIKGFAFIKYWSWDSGRSWPRWNRIGRPIH
jgi:signal peptidase I